MSSETNTSPEKGKLWDWVPVRMITLILLLTAATIVATLVTRLLVPAAPSPAHSWILLKNLVLPILLVWLYGRAAGRLEQCEPTEILLGKGTPLFFLGAVFGMAIIGIYVVALSGIGAAHLGEGTGIPGVVPLLNEVLVPWATAVGEELLFRLILFRLIEEALGTTMAALISALLFGLAHAMNPGGSAGNALYLAVGMGTLLAFAYAATRNVWFPIGLHFGWNFAEGFLFGLPNSGQLDPVRILRTTVSGPAILTGGAFGPEGSLLLCVLALVGTAIFATLTLRLNRWQTLRFSLRRVSAGSPGAH
jgi:membrane protease YdiL (CAAX protease family)